MKKNQNGFSILEVLIVIVIVGLIGAVGWLVWDRQKNNKETATTNGSQIRSETDSEEGKNSELPSGFVKYEIGATGVTLAYPSSWGAPKEIAEDKGGGYDVNGMTFNIQDEAGLKISRSFNAPSYCAYNSADDTWVKAGEYPPSSCEPSVLTVKGINAHGFSKGALGAYGFSYAINLKSNKFLLISDSLLYDGTQAEDAETYPSEEDTKNLKSELDKNTDIVISNNLAIFE